MSSDQNKTPSVLMLLLSSLGVLISLMAAAITLRGSTGEIAGSSDALMLVSIGTLAISISLINLPTVLYSIQELKGIELKSKHPSLFKSASWAMLGWIILLAAGTIISHIQPTLILLAPITILSIAIPVWWLIESGRRGLKRPSPSKEWGTLTIGLTLMPLVIIVIEVSLVVLVALVVLVILGLQPGSLKQLTDLSPTLGGLGQFDQLLFDLARNPTIASAIFLVVGVIAPFTEELFKPLAVWLTYRRPMEIREGFILGLISGGAFTLLESTSLVSQINSQEWAIAVILRSVTGLLHIGFSGMVGYGIAKARNKKRWKVALLYLLAAAGLHGLWNSMALLNGFSTTPLPVSENIQFTVSGILSIVCMILVFAAVIVITLKLNASLRNSQSENDNLFAN